MNDLRAEVPRVERAVCRDLQTFAGTAGWSKEKPIPRLLAWGWAR